MVSAGRKLLVHPHGLIRIIFGGVTYVSWLDAHTGKILIFLIGLEWLFVSLLIADYYLLEGDTMYTLLRSLLAKLGIYFP